MSLAEGMPARAGLAEQLLVEAVRKAVLLHLLKRGRCSGADLQDDLAAPCRTTRQRIGMVTSRLGAPEVRLVMLVRTGSAETSGWELTEAGRAKAVELQAARARRTA